VVAAAATAGVVATEVVVRAGVVIVTVGVVVAPAGFVPPTDGVAPVEQTGAVVAVGADGAFVRGLLVAGEVVTGGVAAVLVPVPIPLPPSPGVPAPMAIAARGPRIATATTQITSATVTLARGGCWLVRVQRS